MEKTANTTSTSFRLPNLTQEQIKKLGKKWGMTQTAVLILCVDRVCTQAENSERKATHISSDGNEKEEGEDGTKSSANGS